MHKCYFIYACYKSTAFAVLIFTSHKCLQKQVQVFIPTFTQAED